MKRRKTGILQALFCPPPPSPASTRRKVSLPAISPSWTSLKRGKIRYPPNPVYDNREAALHELTIIVTNAITRSCPSFKCRRVFLCSIKLPTVKWDKPITGRQFANVNKHTHTHTTKLYYTKKFHEEKEEARFGENLTHARQISPPESLAGRKHPR